MLGFAAIDQQMSGRYTQTGAKHHDDQDGGYKTRNSTPTVKCAYKQSRAEEKSYHNI
jgi:hypothetical protein